MALNPPEPMAAAEEISKKSDRLNHLGSDDLRRTPSRHQLRRRSFVLNLSSIVAFSVLSSLCRAEDVALRIGIIGLDTSHAVAFARTLNEGPKKPEDASKFAGCKVVAAYPIGSRTIESSTKRVPEYTERVKAMGVEIVDSIDELLKRVDAVLLESNDGNVHLEQLKLVVAAKKPVFVDKPLAGNLKDALKILSLLEASSVPCFCSSSLRYGDATQAVAKGSIGVVSKAETFSPASLDPTHTDLYWYGVHGCEALLTVMGEGCISVRQTKTDDGKIQVEGTWPDGRVGIFREANDSDRKGYGGLAVGEKGQAPICDYDGYDVLLAEVIQMFRTGKAPVSRKEMLELYAFMEAASLSDRAGGKEILLRDAIEQASKP